MHEFGYRDRREREIQRAVSTQDALDEVRNRLLPALSGDRRAGVPERGVEISLLQAEVLIEGQTTPNGPFPKYPSRIWS